MLKAERIDIHPCRICGKTDQILLGLNSVGCHRCENYSLCTNTRGAAYYWNKHNSAPKKVLPNLKRKSYALASTKLNR